VKDSGLVGSTDFFSSYPQGHEPEHCGRGSARADGAQGTPTQSHISPNILEYTKSTPGIFLVGIPGMGGSRSAFSHPDPRYASLTLSLSLTVFVSVSLSPSLRLSLSLSRSLSLVLSSLYLSLFLNPEPSTCG
jgi:hypothetical protein